MENGYHWGENASILIKSKVEQHGEKKFIYFEDADGKRFEKSYIEFQQEVNKLSNAFLDLGIQKRDHVVLHLPNNMEFLSTWFALANIGAIMVPTNILSTADEMNYIINHSEAVVLMTEVDYLDKFEQIREEIPTIQKMIVTRNTKPIENVLNYDVLLANASDQTEPFTGDCF